MANSESTDTSSHRFGRRPSAVDRLRDVSFPLAVRGYDRRAVDDFVEELRNLVAQLESRQSREDVVQTALEEVGVETAGILQRAHETADDLTARSRAAADRRMEEAEREAEMMRREADEYSEQVVVDTRLLWEERQRLIDDVRQLADEVLATADDAMERVKMPEPLMRPELESDPTTSEEELAGPIGLTATEVNGPRPVEFEASDDEPGAYGFDTVEGELVEESEGAETPGHTVELEALPGGAADDDPSDLEPEREPRDP